MGLYRRGEGVMKIHDKKGPFRGGVLIEKNTGWCNGFNTAIGIFDNSLCSLAVDSGTYWI